jgi:hypothetical protein
MMHAKAETKRPEVFGAEDDPRFRRFRGNWNHRLIASRSPAGANFGVPAQRPQEGKKREKIDAD